MICTLRNNPLTSLLLGLVVCVLPACGGGGGGGGDRTGGGSTQVSPLQGSWGGIGADEAANAFAARVTFDASGKLTQVIVNGSDEGLTATTTKLSDNLYQMSYAQGGRGYFLVDDGGTHAFLVHEFNRKVALQKGATGPATTSGDEVVGNWSGYGVVIEDGFLSLLAEFTANMEVTAGRSFEALTSGSVNVTGTLSTHAGSGFWYGSYTDNQGAGLMQVFMTPDQRFTASLACTSGGAFPESCSVAIWSADGGSVSIPSVWYKDADGDGYSNGITLTQSGQPAGYHLAENLTALSGDCNDGAAEVHPGAAEVCGDGVDNDCSAGDASCTSTWYKDADGDGYSDGTTVTQSGQPAGYDLAENLTALSGDCNDASASVHPGATDAAGDGIDQDCDGSDASVAPDVTGIWEITDTVVSGGCIDGTVQTYLVTLAWDGTQLVNTKGSFSVYGTLTGRTADFSGSSYDNPATQYTLTFHSYLLTMSEDGTQVTGSASWANAPTGGGGNPCAGVSELTGVRAQPPATPTNLTAQASGTTVNLSWQDPSATEEGFLVERSGPSASGVFTEIAALAANVESHSDTGLDANSIYSYRVRAHSIAGYSEYTPVAEVTTGEAGPSPDDPVVWARANAVGGWTTVSTSCSPLPQNYILAHFFMCPAGGLRGYEDWSWASWDYVARGTWSVAPTSTPNLETYATILWDYTTAVNVGGVYDEGPGSLAQGDADMLYVASTDQIAYWDAGCWFYAERLTDGTNQDVDDSYCDSSYTPSGDQCGTDADCGRCWYCDKSGSENVCRYGGEGPYGCYRGWDPP